MFFLSGRVGDEPTAGRKPGTPSCHGSYHTNFQAHPVPGERSDQSRASLQGTHEIKIQAVASAGRPAAAELLAASGTGTVPAAATAKPSRHAPHSDGKIRPALT